MITIEPLRKPTPNKLNFSIIEQNVRGTEFEKSRICFEKAVYDKFSFFPDNIGVRHSTGYPNLSVTDLPFKWKVEESSDYGVVIILQYLMDGAWYYEECLFKIDLNENNQPISITGINTYEGITFIKR